MTNQYQTDEEKAFDQWVKDGWHQVYGPNGEITYEQSKPEGKPSDLTGESLTGEVTDYGGSGWGGSGTGTSVKSDMTFGDLPPDTSYDETSMMKAFHQLAISAVMGPQTLSAVEDENAEDNSNATGFVSE